MFGMTNSDEWLACDCGWKCKGALHKVGKVQEVHDEIESNGIVWCAQVKTENKKLKQEEREILLGYCKMRTTRSRGTIFLQFRSLYYLAKNKLGL